MGNKRIDIPDEIAENKNYIFGKKLGNLMGSINPKLQFEATMMALTFIMIGSIVMTIYIIFFSDFALFFKITIPINSVFAIIFLSSTLVTTFQQYQNYLSVNDIKSILESATSIYNSQMLKGGVENG
jgi:hypothetical protein